MARLKYNYLVGYISADITSSQTSIPLVGALQEGGVNIPTISGGDIIVITCGAEIMHITAYTAGALTMTVLRGQGNSVAVAHTQSSSFFNTDTKEDWALLATLASPTFTGEPIAPSLRTTGKTGATTSPLIIAGGTIGGAPIAGAHVQGEIVGDTSGKLWYCTAAGTPGTWQQIGGVTAGTYAPQRLTINSQVGTTYTLQLADESKLIELSNAAGITLTIPTNASVPFAIGTQIKIVQTGVGQVTITPAGGVTVTGTPGLKTAAQWGVVDLIKRGTDTWLATNNLAA